MKEKRKRLKLGDLLEKAIMEVAPDLAKKAKENGCNCEKRKEWLNNLV